MVSSKLSNTLKCRIRKEEVAAQAEERVRQNLLVKMIDGLGYPESLLVVEKALDRLPHLQNTSISLPDRRADILCFGREIHEHAALYPLLLVECKAHALNERAIQQVAGYNHFVKSYFIAVANDDEVRVAWYSREEKKYHFVSFLPTYQELIAAVKLQRQ